MGSCSVLYESCIIKAVHNPNASHTFIILLKKASAYDSLDFLTIPFVIVAALCVMAFQLFVFFS